MLIVTIFLMNFVIWLCRFLGVIFLLLFACFYSWKSTLYNYYYFFDFLLWIGIRMYRNFWVIFYKY